jgi:hypothetical protein
MTPSSIRQLHRPIVLQYNLPQLVAVNNLSDIHSLRIMQPGIDNTDSCLWQL